MAIKYKNLTMIKVPISTIRKIEIVSLGRLTMGQWYNKQSDKPDYMSSASLWDSKGPIGTIYLDGKMTRNMGNGFGFGIAKNGSTAFGGPWDYEWNDYITGYPGIIRNGEALPITLDDNYVMNSVTKRSAVAASGNDIYLVAGNSLTVKGLQQQLLSYGMYHAINLDGGGTSRLMINGEAINRPTDNRACKLAICIWLKKNGGSTDSNTNNNANNNSTTNQNQTGGNKVRYDVAIDAGHDKTTAGKRSPDGTYFEYEFNHDVAGRVKKHLERCGVSVILTAPDPNKYVSLADRCKIANNANVKCVVSIHTNAAGESWSSANYWVGYIIARGGNAEKLGKIIEKRSIPYLGLLSNGIQKNNLAIVRDTDAPAVLVEHGFHTNREWLVQLKSDSYREKCAIADSKGICEFLGVKWIEPETIKPDEPTNPDNTGMWYDDVMKWATDEGIITDQRPNDFVTRAECLTMIQRALNK